MSAHTMNPTFTPRAGRTPWAAVAFLALVAGVPACGDLDNVTTIKDLRVLAVQAEPPGFLVPLDDPASISATESTLTALVVDPKGQGATLSVSAEACPDYIDTITTASGKGSKLCPGADLTGRLPPPLDTALATKTLADASPTMPMPPSTIEYDPTVKYGLAAAQVGLFFAKTPTGVPTIDQSVAYNRDFSMDAIVSFDFVLGTEKAAALKRVVYWPQLPPELLAAPALIATPDGPKCPAQQVANQNPKLTRIDLYRHRVEGVPTDLWTDATPTLSLAKMGAEIDQLYVQPVPDPAAAESYYLRVKDVEAGTIGTDCRKELLTFQFFTTLGTMSPEDRRSEPLPFQSPDTIVRTDSQFNPPKAADLLSAGAVTLWVVVRDERAGVGWLSRTINVTP
jgi:hypothetical protein